MALSQRLFDAIVDGKAQLAQSLVEEELRAGADPLALLSETMIAAMDEVGKLFQEEEFFVPELLLSARAMKAAMEPLRPLLAAKGAKPAGVVVAGAVKGDLHDIGKNLVTSMLEGAGFQVIDLGSDVAPEAFVAAIRERHPQIVCLSALLTVTMEAIFWPRTFSPRALMPSYSCVIAATTLYLLSSEQNGLMVGDDQVFGRLATSADILPPAWSSISSTAMAATMPSS